jgi:DNA-binding transcriptional MerR regulator
MKNERKKIYSIGETARICGVTAKQLRHWEQRGFIPLASRVICGKRAYREFGSGDLDTIRRIKGFLDDGFTVSAAAKKAAAKNKQITGGAEDERK